MFAMIVLLAIFVVTLLYLRNYQKYRFASKFPSLEPWLPLVGNAHLVWKSEVEQFETLVKVFSEHDRVVKVWAGPMMLLFVSHPDLVQKILSSPDCLERSYLYKFAGFQEGIFSAKYKTWHVMRKRLNPCFNLRLLHEFIPTFEKCAKKLTARLNELPSGTTVNILGYILITTLEMACGSILGTDIIERDGKKEFVHAMDGHFEGAFRRMVNVHFYSDIIFRMTKYHRELEKARKDVYDFLNQIALERWEKLSPKHDCTSGSKGIEQLRDDYQKPRIMIDQLLKVCQEGVFNDSQIEDNIAAVITGANDTTGLLISHACLFLCFHKDIQEKLHAEIIQFLPTDEIPIDADNLKQLVYLDKFLKECLRHCPIGPNISRENMAEIELDGVKVPPGNIFVMNFYALHRRKDFWGPDAEKFDPENFTEERSKNRHPFAYLPFSGGNRICIGWRYATYSMKVMLIYLVRNFQFDTEIKPEEVRYKHDITMKLPFEHLIQVTKRRKNNF